MRPTRRKTTLMRRGTDIRRQEVLNSRGNPPEVSVSTMLTGG